jgi:hypothetical protein
MFEDFDISITSAEPPVAGANVTVRFGNVNETGSFSLSAVAEAVSRLNAALLEPRPAPETLQKAGAELFDALFDRCLSRTYSECARSATERGRQLRLRLISDIPSIVAVPWEYLYDSDRGHWLALHPERSFVRSLPLAGGESLPVDETLRVLVMLADPSDLPWLDSAREWAQLDEATATAAIDLIRIEPTYEALQGALRLRPHVFHFVGHGSFPGGEQGGEADATRHIRPTGDAAGEAAPQGALAFCKDGGASDLIEADRLASLVAGCKTLRLVLLNACQGSVAGARSAFAGVAQKLIQQGTPAVIAMQAPIYDDHALRFSQEFYRALADGYSVEGAVHQGRIRINEVSYAWGIPTLYFQGVEPFSIQPLSNAEKAARLWQKVERLDVA